MTTSTPTVRKLGPHPVVLRELRVARSVRLGPRMIRVTLHGEDLAGFESPGPDDHVVLFITDRRHVDRVERLFLGETSGRR